MAIGFEFDEQVGDTDHLNPEIGRALHAISIFNERSTGRTLRQNDGFDLRPINKAFKPAIHFG